MPLPTDVLAQAYAPRRAAHVADDDLGDWKLKLYGLADPAKGVRDELLDATRSFATRNLPTQDGYGAAFAIAHDANFPIALVYWWQGVNELHQRVWVGEDLDTMEPVQLTPAGCVYELAIVEFERRAWIEDVIGNPGGPDLDAYMSRRFEGMV